MNIEKLFSSMLKSKLIILIFVGLIILFSGCITNQEENKENISPTSPTSIDEGDKINELENEIITMQQQINELQTRVDRVDLMKPSNNNLIPEVPFKIRIDFGKMDFPLYYQFNKNGEVELTQGDYFDRARYELYPENNTIIINSLKYDYFDLVLYDEYVIGKYDNGLHAWAYKYKITLIEE